MNQDLKHTVLESIARAHVEPRKFDNPKAEAYHAHVGPFFIRIQRNQVEGGFKYILTAHGVKLTDFVYVPNTHTGFISADMVDLPEIWHAMESKYQSQQRDIPMDSTQEYWYGFLRKFISEYDHSQTVKIDALTKSKQPTK